ncbi:conserved hypothetical protein [Klebsiella quasipneumoniae subsp. quasipneumoniae]|nr:conserved hypothetical protein [Klebsiella quasipneumoniae subsp. quasipneumoniae]
MAKRTGYRLFHHHFAQLTHDQKGDKTGNRITKNDTRAGGLNDGRAPQKQAGADSPAQRDELDMAVFEAALQPIAVLLTFHMKPRVWLFFVYVIRQVAASLLSLPESIASENLGEVAHFLPE